MKLNKESMSHGSEVIRNSIIPSKELDFQISYSSSSTAVAISLGINILLPLLDLPAELGIQTPGIVEVLKIAGIVEVLEIAHHLH